MTHFQHGATIIVLNDLPIDAWAASTAVIDTLTVFQGLIKSGNASLPPFAHNTISEYCRGGHLGLTLALAFAIVFVLAFGLALVLALTPAFVLALALAFALVLALLFAYAMN